MIDIRLSPIKRHQAIVAASSGLDFVLAQKATLAASIIRYYWFGGSARDVIVSLRRHRNPDGGFGRKLLPDVVTRTSNPFATLMAMQVIGLLPADTTEETRKGLRHWLISNQHEDGEWHIPDEFLTEISRVRHGQSDSPSLYPACSLVGRARMLGIATRPMEQRVRTLFTTHGSIQAAGAASGFDLIPYVDYVHLLQESGDRKIVDAVIANIMDKAEQKGFERADQYFRLVLGASDLVTNRVPDQLTREYAARLLDEQGSDGSWAVPNYPGLRAWNTAMNLAYLAKMRDWPEPSSLHG